MTDAAVGEEIREVVPQTELRVMTIGVLQTLDRRDGFDPLSERLEPIDALLQQPRVRIGTLQAGLETRLYDGDARECDDQQRERARAAAINHGSAPAARHYFGASHLKFAASSMLPWPL
jgi:hypothetical protein